MKTLLFSLVLLATPVYAQTIHHMAGSNGPVNGTIRIESVDPAENNGAVASITMNNAPTIVGDQTFYLSMNGVGKFSVHVQNTNNRGCNPECPDTISIVGVPEGYIVAPPSLTVEEGSSGSIFVYPSEALQMM